MKTHKIHFWGVRGSNPTPEANKSKIGGETACVEVRCGEKLFIFDAGTGLHEFGARFEGIGKVEFTREDVVRHPLVQSIVHAYEKASAARDRSAALPASRE